MLKSLPFVVLLAVASAMPAAAACPPVTPASLPEAVQANGQRIVCIQNELAAATRQRQYEFELKALQNQLQNIQLQQKFDTLPPPYVPLPVFQ